MTKTGQPQYDNVSVSRNISFASLTQYDNISSSLRAVLIAWCGNLFFSVIASKATISRHCERGDSRARQSPQTTKRLTKTHT